MNWIIAVIISLIVVELIIILFVLSADQPSTNSNEVEKPDIELTDDDRELIHRITNQLRVRHPFTPLELLILEAHDIVCTMKASEREAQKEVES